MTTAELRSAIRKPAEQARLDLEPGLVDLLLRDTGADPDDDQSADYDPGALPLLSYALLTTWQRRRGHLLTVAGYREVGGVAGAISTSAEHTFTTLEPGVQQAAKRLLLQMVRVGDDIPDTRHRANVTDLLQSVADTTAAEAALEAFAKSRLVTRDHDTAQITHEALIRSWPKLRAWMDEDRAGLLVSGAAVFAFQQRATAQRARDTAIFNQITAEADRLRSTDVSLAAQLDLTAYRMRPESPDAYTALITAGNATLTTPLTGHANGVNTVAFSPDGHTLATGGSADKTVRLWEMNVDHAIQRICATTRNTLTPAKWAQYVSPDLPYRLPCP
jgi:WD domain, G-beta repeat